MTAHDGMTPEKLFGLVAGQRCTAVLLTLPGGETAGDGDSAGGGDSAVDAVRVFEDLASVGLSFPDVCPPPMEPCFRENPAALADVLSYFNPNAIVLVALPESACLLAYGGARFHLAG